MKTIRKTGKTQRGCILERDTNLNEFVSIETRVKRAIEGEGDVDMIRNPYYTPRNAGVPIETNIRTDRMEVLRESIGKAQNEYYESRKSFNEEKEKPVENSAGPNEEEPAE